MLENSEERNKPNSSHASRGQADAGGGDSGQYKPRTSTAANDSRVDLAWFCEAGVGGRSCERESSLAGFELHLGVEVRAPERNDLRMAVATGSQASRHAVLIMRSMRFITRSGNCAAGGSGRAGCE